MSDKPPTLDDVQARGKNGPGTDTTPDENYTVPGVLARLPTPETDPALLQQIADAEHDKQLHP